MLTSDKKLPPQTGGGYSLPAFSFALNFIFLFAGGATLSRIVALPLVWRSPLLLIALRFLFTEWVRLLLSGLLPARLLTLIFFVCHCKLLSWIFEQA